jgi:uncharacterized protein (TIGR02246 family)
MKSHPVKQVIEAAERAIAAEDFDALMEFYDDDAVLVIKPGLYAMGKAQIRQAFVRIAEYFNHSISVKHGNMILLEGGSTALVISEMLLESVDNEGLRSSIVRTGTYVFRKGDAEKWVCAIDNSYGADLLKAGSELGASQN